MQSLVNQLTEHLLAQTKSSDPFQAFSEFMATLGYPNILYANVSMKKNKKPDDVIIADTFDPEWMDFYNSNGIFHKDPIAWHVTNRQTPVFFPDLHRVVDKNSQLAPHFKEGADLTRDWGVKNAISAAINSRANVSVGFTLQLSSDLSEKEARSHLIHDFPRIHPLFEVFHAHYDASQMANDHFALTRREIEVLKWLCDGLVAKQIAHKTATSIFTVQKQIASARRRLDAATTTQAVAKAIIWGLI